MRIKQIMLFSVSIDFGMELTRYASRQVFNPALKALVTKIKIISRLAGWGSVCMTETS